MNPVFRCYSIWSVKTYFVYLLTNRKNGTLYTGVTSSLSRRIWQHKNKIFPGFSSKYGLTCLVYFEDFRDIRDAIAREKQIKAGSRKAKLVLIEKDNPGWVDLAADWFEQSFRSTTSGLLRFARNDKRG